MRFQKKIDCYLDTKTGLDWSLENLDSMGWEDAVINCNSLGHGWRLPTLDELITLIMSGRKVMPATNLPGMIANSYWSSTTFVGTGNTYYAWLMDFNNGETSWINKDNVRHVRAIRSL